jgi:hypothetical protein
VWRAFAIFYNDARVRLVQESEAAPHVRALHSRSLLASPVLKTRPMLRLVSIVAALVAGVGRADAGDLVEVDGEAFASPFDPWLGASLHYEHRFADSQYGVTFRGSAHLGVEPLNDDLNFTMFDALVGLREHWGNLHFEAAIGVGIGHDADETAWGGGPAFEIEVGHTIGPVEVSLYAALVGLGLRVGVALGG